MTWVGIATIIAFVFVFTNGIGYALTFLGTCLIPEIAVAGIRWGLIQGDKQQRIGTPIIGLLLLGFGYWLSTGIFLHIFGFTVSGIVLASISAFLGFGIPLSWGGSPNNEAPASPQLASSRSVASLFAGNVLRDMSADAAHPDAPPSIINDWRIIKAWLGATSDALTIEQKNMWEQTYLSYVAEGRAPSIQLEESFAHFAKRAREEGWAVIPITDEIRGVCDRLYTTDGDLKKKQPATT